MSICPFLYGSIGVFLLAVLLVFFINRRIRASLPYEIDLPAGATIVLCSAAIYLLALLTKRYKQK